MEDGTFPRRVTLCVRYSLRQSHSLIWISPERKIDAQQWETIQVNQEVWCPQDCFSDHLVAKSGSTQFLPLCWLCTVRVARSCRFHIQSNPLAHRRKLNSSNLYRCQKCRRCGRLILNPDSWVPPERHIQREVEVSLLNLRGCPKWHWRLWCKLGRT